MNKKAQLSFKAIIWIFRILFVIALAFSVFILVRTYIKINVDVEGIEADLFLQRLIYSTNGISYFDKESQRLMPGIIDIEKFDSPDFEKNLEKAIFYGKANDHIGAKIIVLDKEDKIETIKYYNKDFFEEKEILAKAGLTKGVGGARITYRELSCFIKRGTAIRKGTIKVEIVMSN